MIHYSKQHRKHIKQVGSVQMNKTVLHVWILFYFLTEVCIAMQFDPSALFCVHQKTSVPVSNEALATLAANFQLHSKYYK